MTIIVLHRAALHPSRPRRFVSLRNWMTMLVRCRQLCLRQRQRRQLLELDARMRADIGITREDAEREAAKWFWQ